MDHADTPAAKVLRLFGGHEAVRDAVGLRSTLQIRRWSYPKEKGGTGGQVPPRHHAALLAAARGRGLGLQPSDLLPWLDGPVQSPSLPDAAAQRGAAA